jgi:hypothetical protein
MAFGSLQQLRTKRVEAITVKEPSLLETIIETKAVIEAERISPVLAALADAEVAPLLTPDVVTETKDETEETRYVAFQTIGFLVRLIPCPACKCYPCKPGHVNGHREV